jgi:MYXO-CTERM domain-containing protein
MSQVEVTDVFAGAGIDPVAPGDLIQGVLESASCGLSLGSFDPGDDVLALWQGTMPDLLECQEYVDCDDERCAPWGANAAMVESCRLECIEETRDACPAPTPRMVLVPWREELELGEGRTLPVDRVGILADRGQCNLVLAPPPKPCNDVIFHEVSDGCSVGAVGSASDDRQLSCIGWLFALLLAFGFVRARRRVPV